MTIDRGFREPLFAVAFIETSKLRRPRRAPISGVKVVREAEYSRLLGFLIINGCIIGMTYVLLAPSPSDLKDGRGWQKVGTYQKATKSQLSKTESNSTIQTYSH
jgi:hypothetical protein